MISRIRGQLVRRELEGIEVMTAAGVAYEMEIPRTVFERLPRVGGDVELRTVQVVREDALMLFGFLTDSERGVFARLMTTSGIGPRLALAILSALTPERLIRAIAERDVELLRQVPGIGRKTAERMVLELGDRLSGLAGTGAGPRPDDAATEEAVGALVALGFSPPDALSAVRKALDAGGPLSGVELIKAALATRGR